MVDHLLMSIRTLGHTLITSKALISCKSSPGNLDFGLGRNLVVKRRNITKLNLILGVKYCKTLLGFLSGPLLQLQSLLLIARPQILTLSESLPSFSKTHSVQGSCDVLPFSVMMTSHWSSLTRVVTLDISDVAVFGGMQWKGFSGLINGYACKANALEASINC